jgi:arylsulfatase A-like enzyme
MKNNSQIGNINLVLLSLLYTPALGQAGQQNFSKPNILFIAVDDLKPVLGCYGDKLIKTPNIDRIAANGMIFSQNFCQQAVSGPTRASLMTGKRPDYTKVWDLKTKMRDVNPDILTLPQYFSQQGIITAAIGKIYDSRCVDEYADKPSWSIPFYGYAHKNSSRYYYNAQKPLLLHFQDPERRKLIEKYMKEAKAKGMNAAQSSAYAKKYAYWSTECVDLPDNAYDDGAMTANALEILNQLSEGKKQFFFAVGFNRPHLPFVAPKKYWDLYDRKDMPLAKFQEHAKNSPELAYTNSGELRSYSDIPPLTSFTDVKVNHTGLPFDKQKELIHGYYASVSYTDALIGKLLNALDSLGLKNNTIIVLWGDHGWHLGDHDLWCKHTNFEQATHAPLLISVPGMQPGKTQSLTEFIDIFPTLCDLLGLQKPADLDGVSLVPLLKDPALSVNKYAVSQYPHEGKMGYSIRTKNYRLTWWMKDGFTSSKHFDRNLIVAKELYDYNKDPLETINVADQKSYEAIRNELENNLIAFFRKQEIK